MPLSARAMLDSVQKSLYKCDSSVWNIRGRLCSIVTWKAKPLKMCYWHFSMNERADH